MGIVAPLADLSGTAAELFLERAAERRYRLIAQSFCDLGNAASAIS
jgi:hypothetical protein